ncbi:MAG: alanine racemase [Christensenellales bacterium]|jgi:alanine racemase
MRPTKVTVHLEIIVHNIRQMKSRLPKGTKLMAVIKADGYGHGMLQVARAAIAADADYLGLATVDEAAELRREGIYAPVLLLGASVPEDAYQMVACDVIETVWRPDHLGPLAQAARKLGKPARVHIKVDSGMGRIGLRTKRELLEMLEYIGREELIHPDGIYTHFATADEADPAYRDMQARRFSELLSVAKGHYPDIMAHAGNSAIALHAPQYHYDMVRVGYQIYGYDPGPGNSGASFLKPALEWTTKIADIKCLPKGEGVSYGVRYFTACDTKVATLPVGYADGYRRALTNNGYVLVRGERCPIIGTVCMDQCMIDVSHLHDVQIGDDVVLLGGQGEDFISADEMGRWLSTIGYEILCGIGRRVPRSYTGLND